MSCLRQLFKYLVARSELVLLVILLAIFAAYRPVLNGQFIWDDSYLVGENPLFRSPIFALEVFRHHLFLDSISTYYRPVQNLSYMVDYWFWRGNPFGYHFSNILLHGFSAFFLFLLLKKILPRLIDSGADESEERLEVARGIAFCVALIWGVHPIHNAAVAYISGRADSLIAFFALGAWLLFLKSDQLSSQWRWPLRCLSLLAALLALCSKEAGLLWMGLFVVWVFGIERGFSRAKRLGLLMASLMVVGVYAWLHHLPPTPAAATRVIADPFPQRLILMFRAMGDYIGLIFWPAHLHMERTLGLMGPCQDLASWIGNIPYEYKAILGALSLGALAYGSLKKWTGQRLRILGGVWFLIGFLPISNLIPLNAQSAEHWIYMPSIGLLLFLAGAVAALPRGRAQVTLLVLMATIPLVTRTAYRSADWVDENAFFSQTMREGGDTHRVQLNLSNLATLKGDLHAAEGTLRATLRQFPDSPLARIKLGINLIDQKDPAKEEEAEKLLSLNRAVLEQVPYAWRAPLNLARLRVSQHREWEALRLLDNTIEFYPELWELVSYKAAVLQKTQGAAAALPGIQRYVDAHWWHFAASMALGELRSANGEFEPAMSAWRNAGRLDIRNAQPFLRMAKYAFAQHQYALALDAQKKAIGRDPDRPSDYLFLAAIFDGLQRPSDSEAALRQAQALGNRARGG